MTDQPGVILESVNLEFAIFISVVIGCVFFTCTICLCCFRYFKSCHVCVDRCCQTMALASGAEFPAGGFLYEAPRSDSELVHRSDTGTTPELPLQMAQGPPSYEDILPSPPAYTELFGNGIPTGPTASQSSSGGNEFDSNRLTVTTRYIVMGGSELSVIQEDSCDESSTEISEVKVISTDEISNHGVTESTDIVLSLSGDHEIIANRCYMNDNSNNNLGFTNAAFSCIDETAVAELNTVGILPAQQVIELQHGQDESLYTTISSSTTNDLESTQES